MPSVRQAAPLDELDELEEEDELDDELEELAPPPALPPPPAELLDALVLPPAPLLVLLLLLEALVEPLDWKRSPASTPQPGASSATVRDASAAARQR